MVRHKTLELVHELFPWLSGLAKCPSELMKQHARRELVFHALDGMEYIREVHDGALLLFILTEGKCGEEPARQGLRPCETAAARHIGDRALGEACNQSETCGGVELLWGLGRITRPCDDHTCAIAALNNVNSLLFSRASIPDKSGEERGNLAGGGTEGI